MDADPKCKPELVDFDKLFFSVETGEEQYTSVASVLSTIAALRPCGCTAQMLCRRITDDHCAMQNLVAALELGSGKAFKTSITPTTISWRLKAIKDQPTNVGDKTLVLREFADNQANLFRVVRVG
jgi:hypothetical protein